MEPIGICHLLPFSEKKELIINSTTPIYYLKDLKLPEIWKVLPTT